MSITDVDDFADLDFDAVESEAVDEFADLDEFAEPEPVKPAKPEPEPEPKPEPDKPARKQAVYYRGIKRSRRIFLLNGHCVSTMPPDSHKHCSGGNNANPDREYQACPCKCHGGETYECGNCGRTIVEAPNMRPLDPSDDDMVYTHVDATGRMIGEDCP